MTRARTMPGWPGLGLVLAAVIVAASVAAPQASRPAGDGAVADADRTALRALIARLGERPAYDPPSAARYLSAPRGDIPELGGWTPLVPDRDAARRATLAERAAHRAYDGAPPVMPHSRNFVRDKVCLDCHENGFWLGKRFGPPLSHPQLLNCQQCHVESANLDLPFRGRVENAFDGQDAPVGGTRAWDTAPPVIPHGTHMRNRCLSCHGPGSYPGLRTDHPERINCVQCHAVATSLDQTSPFFTGAPTLVREP